MPVPVSKVLETRPQIEGIATTMVGRCAHHHALETRPQIEGIATYVVLSLYLLLTLLETRPQIEGIATSLL